MISENLTQKWINYPWFYGHGVDFLVHPEDIGQLVTQGMGLGLVLCIADDEEFITVRYKSTVIRVNKIGVKNVFPSPSYVWDQKVKIKNRSFEYGFVRDVIWHQKEEKYYYRLVIANKIAKKRYYEDDLEPND